MNLKCYLEKNGKRIFEKGFVIRTGRNWREILPKELLNAPIIESARLYENEIRKIIRCLVGRKWKTVLICGREDIQEYVDVALMFPEEKHGLVFLL